MKTAVMKHSAKAKDGSGSPKLTHEVDGGMTRVELANGVTEDEVRAKTTGAVAVALI